MDNGLGGLKDQQGEYFEIASAQLFASIFPW